MANLTAGKIVHLLGMGLVYAGVAICGWTVYRLSQGVVDGQIVTSAPMARIWWWGVAILLLGLPLFLSRWRTQRGGKVLFDIAIGLFMTFPILLLLDAGFGRINAALASETSRQVELPNPIAEGDEQLGYKNRASAEIPTWFVENGVTTIEATYHTDEFGRRLTPTANEDSEQHLLFFGGS